MLKHTLNLLLAALLFAAVSGCGRTPEKAMNNAAALAADGKWREAYRQLERVERMAPDNFTVLLFLAVAADHCGETDRALDSARRAAALDSSSFAAQYTLGRLYSKQPERRTDAMKHLLAAWRLRSNDVNTLVLLAKNALAMNDSKALNFLTTLRPLGQFSTAPELYNEMAVASIRRKDYRTAARMMTQAYNYGRNTPEIVFNLARFFDEYTTDRNSAKRFYNEYLQLTGRNVEAYGQWRAQAERRLSALNRQR